MTRLLESAVKRSTEGTTFRALESYVSGAVVYSDDFNRADTTPAGGGGGGTGLGAEWDSESWYISSNTARRTVAGSANDFAVFQHDLGTHDMWSEADVTPNGNYGVMNVRSAQSVLVLTSYQAFFNAGAGLFEIGKGIAGVYQMLTQSAPGVSNTTRKLRFEAEGTALRLYENNVLVLSYSHSEINSIDYPNNRYAGMNANPGPVFDNFRCGPLPWTP